VPLTERSSVDDFVICRRREERRERWRWQLANEHPDGGRRGWHPGI